MSKNFIGELKTGLINFFANVVSLLIIACIVVAVVILWGIVATLSVIVGIPLLIIFFCYTSYFRNKNINIFR